MSKNKFIAYNPKLKSLARDLRQNSTLSEILLWMNIKNKVLGYEFHRQVPLNEFIVDFYCHELSLAIEIDGNTHNYNFVKDESRQEMLENLGVFVLRFTDEDVKKFMNDVLRSIQFVIMDIENKKTSP